MTTVNIISMLKGLREAGCRITTICKCKGYSSFKTSYRPRASIIDHSLNFYTPIITYLDSPHSKLLCIISTLTIFASCIVVFNNNTAIQITEIVYVLKLLKLSYFINNSTVISNNRILVRTVVINNNTVIQMKLCKFKLS